MGEQIDLNETITVYTNEPKKKMNSKIVHFCEDQTIAGEATLDCVILDGHILNILDFLTLN